MARTKPKARARERTLTDDELRKIWAAAQGPFGHFIQFLLLTATRRSEAANAHRSEFAKGDWIVPGRRYKTGTDHLVPLSAAAQALLAKLPAKGFMFSTDGGETPKSGFSKFVIKTALKQADRFDEVARAITPSLDLQLKNQSPFQLALILTDVWPADNVQALIKELNEHVKKSAASESASPSTTFRPRPVQAEART
jgi:hypothetical protein